MDVISTIQKRKSIPEKIAGHFRGKLVAGLFALIPLVVTLFVLRIVFNAVDGTVQPLVEEIFGRRIPGVGIALTVIIVYIMGVIATNFIGRQMIRSAETVIFRVPFIKTVYKVAREVVEILNTSRNTAFRVVLVQWPSKGTYTIGLVTGSVVAGNGRKYLNILIPTTPTPQSGILAIIPEEEVVQTSLTFEEGLRIIISSGFISPEGLMKTVNDSKASPVNPDCSKGA